MKITIEDQDKIYTVESQHEMDMDQMVDTLKGLLVQYGFHPQTVDYAFASEAGENSCWNLEQLEPQRNNTIDMEEFHKQTN